MIARRGVALVVVLWVVAILAVVCLALGGSVRFKQIQLVRRREELRSNQALLSAIAVGVGALSADEASADVLSDNWAGGDAAAFSIPLAGAHVDVYVPDQQGRRAGLEDESARLNANTASAEMLAALPGMTMAAAEAFVAGRDQAASGTPTEALTRPLGGVTGPYATPWQLVEALASAFARSGLALENLTGSGETMSWAAQTGQPAGVALVENYLTVYSRQRNLDAQGRQRVNLNTATKQRMASDLGGAFSEEQIDAIIAARAARPFESIGELLLRQMKIPDGQGGLKTVRIGRPEFETVADRLTVTDDKVLVGRVNVNTAAKEVLEALPGLEAAGANAIVAARAKARNPQSIAWLLSVLDERAFAELCPYVTTRSQQFRMYAEARSGQQSQPGATEAMAILERDAGRCGVLLWMTWRGRR